MSATYIFLFILFGSFLEQAGMIRLFTDFAMGLFGHRAGGPAKVSVVSSALMGTITGSGVANVVTTGQFTIPLMKRFGYRAAFAGGVEATASMGSQIMPPVMGAVAFIMAETINVPYVEVAKAALIPALLYFGSVFWMVHLEAKRSQLNGLPKEECPSAWDAVRQRWFLLIRYDPHLAAVLWPYADVCRHRGAGADSHCHSGLADPAPAIYRCAGVVLDSFGGSLCRLLPAGHRCDLRCDRCAGSCLLVRQGGRIPCVSVCMPWSKARHGCQWERLCWLGDYRSGLADREASTLRVTFSPSAR